MPLRVHQIRVPVDGDEAELLKQALRKAGVGADAVRSLEVVRRSLDRRRRTPVFSFTVDLHLREGMRGPATGHGVEHVEAPVTPDVPSGSEVLEHRPVVVGAGPAGLFAALYMAQRGYRPILLERGDPMNLRVGRIREMNQDGVLDPEMVDTVIGLWARHSGSHRSHPARQLDELPGPLGVHQPHHRQALRVACRLTHPYAPSRRRSP